MAYEIELLVIIVTAAVIIISRIKWKHMYWKRKGLFSLEPHFLFGNTGNPFNRKTHFGIVIQNAYNEIKNAGTKHGGIYMLTNPMYVPVDPDILKNVMMKDFQHFQDRGFYYNEKDDPLSANLFAIFGSKWRRLRTKLTPTFTASKMKIMFDTMVECADIMHESMKAHDGSNDGIEIKELFARYTTDVIGSCAFGLECNSFKNENADFRKHGKNIFKPYSMWKSFSNILAFSYPNFARRLGIKLFAPEISAFFIDVVKCTVKAREVNKVKRNDMLQLLIDLTEDTSNPHGGKALTIDEIAAQVFVFFVAGFDTSSSTMTFCLYELAVNPDIQAKVRTEINNVLNKYNGKITYEAIVEMKFMGIVIDETLRKYPPLAYLTRKCVEDYKVPGTDMVVEKGTRLCISTLGLHYDPEYFPDPEKFDPERFSDGNRVQIRPFTYLPFGEGPRICIGLRFGLMQAKVGLTVLLRNYVVSLNKKTVLPFNLDRYNFIITPRDGVWLNVKSIA